MKTTELKTAAYIRVSTDNQTELSPQSHRVSFWIPCVFGASDVPSSVESFHLVACVHVEGIGFINAPP